MTVTSVVAGVTCATPRPATGETDPLPRRVRLGVGADAALSIGALPAFAYDGRAGLGEGSAVETSPGVYALHFPAAQVTVPPLEMVPFLPRLPLEVEIVPRDLNGTFDVCSGEMELDFDAVFVPRVGSRRLTPLSVVTPLTSGAVPLDALGSGRLSGTAQVPATGDVLVDTLLRLPAAASADLPVHVHFAGGPPACPADSVDPSARGSMEVRPDSRLKIGRRFPWFPYDGKGSGGGLDLTPVTGTPGATHEVVVPVDSLHVPPLLMFPPFTQARVEIQPAEMRGVLDACTGSVHLAFDAVFQPVVGTWRTTPIAVVTDLTTGVSSGDFTTLTGAPMDEWGDLRLVGVARVPKTGDLFVDLLLGLPTDAVTDMAVHIDLPAGIGCPGAASTP
ncbi:MAG: hypothetical protein IT198_06505 [Acidimicrobiia bacterium]|nr:hypothetical protein [Acidimicrobiia bacterium]